MTRIYRLGAAWATRRPARSRPARATSRVSRRGCAGGSTDSSNRKRLDLSLVEPDIYCLPHRIAHAVDSSPRSVDRSSPCHSFAFSPEAASLPASSPACHRPMPADEHMAHMSAGDLAAPAARRQRGQGAPNLPPSAEHAPPRVSRRARAMPSGSRSRGSRA